MGIQKRIKEAKARIKEAALSIGKDPYEVALVVVTKGQSVEAMREAVDSGARIIAESRVQEAEEKFAGLDRKAEKHFIGHLQSNKVKKAVELFDLIQSVDSLKLAEMISSEAVIQGKVMPVLIQINIGMEEQKHGLMKEELKTFLLEASKFKGIKIQGLMAVPPLDSRNGSLKHFNAMKGVFDSLFFWRIKNVEVKFLSMGMSADFESAIRQGANMVRIGSMIFS
ncbi:MAG TPA: YggS family pyridoxal phosphate-dependent enzyme [archaeon]|nr:YggS family pyridoxal phosphate-dependent enzyme [archaeon]